MTDQSIQAQDVDLVFVCMVDELPPGQGVRRVLGDTSDAVALFRTDNGIFAIADTCSHAEASLSDGYVEAGQVECPLHFALFDLSTGVPCSLPATAPVRTYPTTVVDGRVFVDVATERN